MCAIKFGNNEYNHLCWLRRMICEESEYGRRITDSDWLRFSFSEEPIYIQLCRENLDKVRWNILSNNRCPDAVQLCRENPNKCKAKSFTHR